MHAGTIIYFHRSKRWTRCCELSSIWAARDISVSHIVFHTLLLDPRPSSHALQMAMRESLEVDHRRGEGALTVKGPREEGTRTRNFPTDLHGNHCGLQIRWRS